MPDDSEPPSCLQRPVFMVGQDSRGNWVACDQSGACGGLFVNRTEALKFARAENGYRPHAVVLVSGVLDLDMSGALVTVPRAQRAIFPSRERRVA
jgi:hypothetical protein